MCRGYRWAEAGGCGSVAANPVSDLHMDVFGDGVPAVLVHGSFGWGTDTFPEQRALADRHKVMLVDRRGYGDSPRADALGWHIDMHDIAAILHEQGGAHLVGQSYGAIVCLLSAAMCPKLVRSLVVIEPPLYEVAAGDPAVDSVIESQKRVYSQAQRLTASAFVSAWSMSRGGSKERVAEWTHSFSAKDWAAADAARKERWPGDAPVDFDVLARAGFPKVVVAGAWRSQIALGRETEARAHRAVCDVIARRIGSQVHVFNDSAHNPQLEEPVRFNELLRTVWA